MIVLGLIGTSILVNVDVYRLQQSGGEQIKLLYSHSGELMHITAETKKTTMQEVRIQVCDTQIMVQTV